MEKIIDGMITNLIRVLATRSRFCVVVEINGDNKKSQYKYNSKGRLRCGEIHAALGAVADDIESDMMKSDVERIIEETENGK